MKKTIEDLLVEKGLGAAKVEYATEKKSGSEIEVVFKIDEGPKIRVAEVEFIGSPKLPQSTLREALKENKPHSIFSWIGGKDAYKQGKVAEDLAEIKKKLQEFGYMEAVVGEPRVEEVSRRTFWPFSKKRTMYRLIIPVEAGFRYMVGDIKVEGNKAFRTEGILSRIKFKKGEIYKASIREKSLEDLSELFREYGYLYAQAVPVETLDPKAKVVNVTYQIMEGDICFLHRLDFKGNVFTKDKVIRREIMIREGDVFRFNLFKDSVLRVKQLGLVDLEKDPDIRPSPEDPSQFDVTMPVKELQRNNIQLSAGYSGYDGTFIAASYETVNFLGAGETLNLTAQYGKRIKNYSFGFTEPYLFDRPISAGFNIYDRYLNYYELYNRKGRGVDLTVNARLLGYLRGSLTYGFEYVDILISKLRLYGISRDVRHGPLLHELAVPLDLPLDHRQPADSELRDALFGLPEIRRDLPGGRSPLIQAPAGIHPLPADHPRLLLAFDRLPCRGLLYQAAPGHDDAVLGAVFPRRRAEHPRLRSLHDRPPVPVGNAPGGRKNAGHELRIHLGSRRTDLPDSLPRPGERLGR